MFEIKEMIFRAVVNPSANKTSNEIHPSRDRRDKKRARHEFKEMTPIVLQPQADNECSHKNR